MFYSVHLIGLLVIQFPVYINRGTFMRSFCNFCRSRDLFENSKWIISCRCNENSSAPMEWIWDNSKCHNTRLSESDKVVLFHPSVSEGTAIARGSKLFTTGFYYWEIKLLSPAYGTDLMVGIGTPELDINKYRRTFNSALGVDSFSWGLSYRGIMWHNGNHTNVPGGAFKCGDIVGCFLDMWHRTLTFFVNRKPITDKIFVIPPGSYYPLVSSTAARTGFRLIYAKSYPMSLQILTCVSLQESLSNPSVIFDLPGFPPGLQKTLLSNLPWLFSERHREKAEEIEKKSIVQSSSSFSHSHPSNNRHIFDDFRQQTSHLRKRHKPDIVNAQMTASQVLDNLLRMGATTLTQPNSSNLKPSSSFSVPTESSPAHDPDS